MDASGAQDRDDEGHLVLRGELFWKWKALHTAVQHCDAEVRVRTPIIDQMLEGLPELKRLIGERSAYVQQSVVQRGEYNNILKQLEAHFGFPMKNVSIDDVSGRVTRHDLVEETPPAVPAPAPTLKNGVGKHAPVRTTTPPAVTTRNKPKKKKRT